MAIKATTYPSGPKNIARTVPMPSHVSRAIGSTTNRTRHQIKMLFKETARVIMRGYPSVSVAGGVGTGLLVGVPVGRGVGSGVTDSLGPGESEGDAVGGGGGTDEGSEVGEEEGLADGVSPSHGPR
jgi:hypothetical protein